MPKHRPPSKMYRPSPLAQLEHSSPPSPICHFVAQAIKLVPPLSDEAHDFLLDPPADREWIANMIVWGRARLLRTTAARLAGIRIEPHSSTAPQHASAAAEPETGVRTFQGGPP